ncbi:MAG: LD-carboxypeptidase [Provencibacterium sp.]|nr:LD-carboxypeptidase [Provencibacterium sp.]
MIVQAKRLTPGGKIGIFCPCHVADRAHYAQIFEEIERQGFSVKAGKNIYRDSYGYAASEKERAADLNALIADEKVGMVLFGGGEGGAEILPLIDYEHIRRHPKLFSSYSDGTSILNAIYAQTGLTTYYGMGAGVFADLRQYDWQQFCARFVEGYEGQGYIRGSRWRSICPGRCEGTLIGGYGPQFALTLANPYFHYEKGERYLLFLEDHEHFSEVGAVASTLAFIEQSGFMRQVSGLIFGHYAQQPPDMLLQCLQRFGERCHIPVAYTDDFGHGTRHAVFPLGIRARLDVDNGRFDFC